MLVFVGFLSYQHAGMQHRRIAEIGAILSGQESKGKLALVDHWSTDKQWVLVLQKAKFVHPDNERIIYYFDNRKLHSVNRSWVLYSEGGLHIAERFHHELRVGNVIQEHDFFVDTKDCPYDAAASYCEHKGNRCSPNTVI